MEVKGRPSVLLGVRGGHGGPWRSVVVSGVQSRRRRDDVGPRLSRREYGTVHENDPTSDTPRLSRAEGILQ